MYVFGFLDALYGGDWTAVAAVEGNRVALYMMANRIYYNRSEARQFLEFNDDLYVRDAAYLYSRSARLGYEPADTALRSLARRHPDLCGPDASAEPVPDIEAIEVFCTPRRYE